MKTFKIVFLLIVVALAFNQCKYSFILPEEEPPVIEPNPEEPNVSFAEDVLPIFNNGSLCTSCHSGSQQPDLTAAKAYTSLNTTKYINSASPEQSLIYTKPLADGTHYKKYTAAQAATILLWIQEGAQNN